MPWGAVAGAAIGVIGNSMNDSGGSQKTSNEPWEPTQEWLKDNIKTGRKLQGYYEQNPFNPLQQRGYENLYSDMDNFRANIAPGLMGFANNLMGSNYQRKAAGTELGAANPYSQGGAPAGIRGLLGNTAPTGLQPRSQQPQQPQQPQQSGLLGAISGLSGQQFAPQQSMQQSMNGLLGNGGQMQGDPSAMRAALGGVAGQGMQPDGGMGSMNGMFSQQPIAAPKLGQDSGNPWADALAAGGGAAMAGGPFGMGQAPSGPFSMGGGQSYGQINWDALNPFKNELKPEEKKPDGLSLTDEEEFNRRLEEWMRAHDPGYDQRQEIRRAGDGGA